MSTVRMAVLVHVLLLFVYISKVNSINWPRSVDLALAAIESENSSSTDGVRATRQYNGDTVVYDSRLGLFLFTRYCGPGARIWQKIFPNGERTYSDIDRCCKMHDSCPNFVEKKEHYDQYPGLEIRSQFFSRFVNECAVDHTFETV